MAMKNQATRSVNTAFLKVVSQRNNTTDAKQRCEKLQSWKDFCEQRETMRDIVSR